jgi:hypothetical protein
MFATRARTEEAPRRVFMTVYRVYRMKDAVRQQFRWAPHTIGVTTAKQKDYEQIQTIEASGPYAVWMQLKDTQDPLQIGDILESEFGDLRIYKYVGFEEAQWHVPEVKPALEVTATGGGQDAVH